MTKRFWLWAALGLALVAAYLGSSVVEFTVDYLWFASLGYGQIFRTLVGLEVALGTAAGALAFLMVYGNGLLALHQIGDPARFLPAELTASPLGRLLTRGNLSRAILAVSALIALLTGLTMSSSWDTLALYLTAERSGKWTPSLAATSGSTSSCCPSTTRRRRW